MVHATEKIFLITAVQRLGSGPCAASQRVQDLLRCLFLVVGAAGGALLLVLGVVILSGASDEWHQLRREDALHNVPQTRGALLVLIAPFIGSLPVLRYVLLHHRKLWVWLLCGLPGAILSILLAVIQISLDRTDFPAQLRSGFWLTGAVGLAFTAWFFGRVGAWPPLGIAALLNGLAVVATGSTAQGHLPGADAAPLLGCAALVGALVGVQLSLTSLDWCFRQTHLLVGERDGALGWLATLLRPFGYLGVRILAIPTLSDAALRDLTPNSVVYARARELDPARRAWLLRRGCTVIRVPDGAAPSCARRFLLQGQLQRLWCL